MKSYLLDPSVTPTSGHLVLLMGHFFFLDGVRLPPTALGFRRKDDPVKVDLIEGSSPDQYVAVEFTSPSEGTVLHPARVTIYSTSINDIVWTWDDVRKVVTGSFPNSK